MNGPDDPLVDAVGPTVAAPRGGTATLRRLVYTSRRTSATRAQAEELAELLQHARRYNAEHAIRGLLLVAQDRFVHWLDGPEDTMQALQQRLLADRRQMELHILSACGTAAPAFPAWPLALSQCDEPATSCIERLLNLEQALAGEGLATAAAAACLIDPAPRPDDESPRQRDVLLISPGGLWGPAVLQRGALLASARPGRMRLETGLPDQEPCLLEGVSLAGSVPGISRALSMSGHWPEPRLLASLLGRLALVTLIIAPSDLPALPATLARLAALLHSLPGPCDVLVVSSIERTRLGDCAEALPVGTRLSYMSSRLSQAADIWHATVATLHATAQLPRPAVAAVAADTAAAVPPPPDADTWTHRARHLMEALLQRAELQGLCSAAVVGLDSTRIHQPAELPCKDEVDFPGLAQFIREKHQLLSRIAPGDAPEEVLMLTTRHLLVGRFLARSAGAEASCLLLALEREQTTPPLVRLALDRLLASLA